MEERPTEETGPPKTDTLHVPDKGDYLMQTNVMKILVADVKSGRR